MSTPAPVIDSLKTVIEQQQAVANAITVVDVGGWVLQGVGFLALIYWGVRLVVGLVKEQGELAKVVEAKAQVVESINKNLREQMADVVVAHENDKAKATERIQSLEADIARTEEALSAKADEHDHAVSIAGRAIIAADFGLRYGSRKLKELTAHQLGSLKAAPKRLGDALGPALTRLYMATTPKEKNAALLDATREIAAEYGNAIFIASAEGIEARWLASRLASLVPLAIEDAANAQVDQTSQALLRRITARMDRNEWPLDGFGGRRIPFLGSGADDESVTR